MVQVIFSFQPNSNPDDVQSFIPLSCSIQVTLRAAVNTNTQTVLIHQQPWPTPLQQRAAMLLKTKHLTSAKRAFAEKNATPKWPRRAKNAWPKSRASTVESHLQKRLSEDQSSRQHQHQAQAPREQRPLPTTLTKSTSPTTHTLPRMLPAPALPDKAARRTQTRSSRP